MDNKKKTFMDQPDLGATNPAARILAINPSQDNQAPPPARPTQAPNSGPYGEAKTRRLQLLLQPSLYAKIQTLAIQERLSVNGLINKALETYTDTHTHTHTDTHKGDK